MPPRGALEKSRQRVGKGEAIESKLSRAGSLVAADVESEAANPQDHIGMDGFSAAAGLGCIPVRSCADGGMAGSRATVRAITAALAAAQSSIEISSACVALGSCEMRIEHPVALERRLERLQGC